ncbi:MAG: hypothetical protein ABI383_13700 [Acidobacteriaceae bacterium]
MRRFCKLLLPALLAAMLHTTAPAQAADQNTPAPASVDKVFADFQKPGSPGCALGVYRDGQIFRNPDNGNIARVSASTGKLQWEIYGGKFALSALAPTEFLPLKFSLDAKLTFEMNTNHAVRDLKVSGGPEITATYQKVAEFTPSTTELAAYTGDFYGDELAVIYRLQVVDGKLALTEISDVSGIPHTGVRMPSTLRPTIQDEFQISNLGVRAHFLKDAKNNVTGFELDAGRSRGIEFQRTERLKDSTCCSPRK